MSKDIPQKDEQAVKEPTTITTEVKAEQPDFKAIREASLARRRKSVIHGVQGPLASYKQYIPEGFVGQFLTPDLDIPRVKYSQGWEFVKDENGNPVRAICNRGKDALEHTFPLMMAPIEVIKEEQAAQKRQAEIDARSQPAFASSADLAGDRDLTFSEEKIKLD